MTLYWVRLGQEHTWWISMYMCIVHSGWDGRKKTPEFKSISAVACTVREAHVGT